MEYKTHNSTDNTNVTPSLSTIANMTEAELAQVPLSVIKACLKSANVRSREAANITIAIIKSWEMDLPSNFETLDVTK